MLDWRTLLPARGMELEHPDVIVVSFGEQGGTPSAERPTRSHRVRVREAEETIELSAVVARPALLREINDLPVRVWRQNRAAQLVSFIVDPRGRLHARGWLPKPGLTAEEFQFVVRRVAAESDRLEFILTGKDLE